MLDAGFPFERGKPVVVIYATFNQHTRAIAERVAGDLEARGFNTELHNARGLPPLNWHNYSAAVLAAPVQLGHHEESMVRFVKANCGSLECLPTAFLSVSLSEAGVERRDETPERHARFAADVQMMLDRFFAETGWRPTMAKAVAGAITYTRYNFLVRWAMKRIARDAGAGLDTRRDYEYTDWDALDAFVQDFAREIRAARDSGARGSEAFAMKESFSVR